MREDVYLQSRRGRSLGPDLDFIIVGGGCFGSFYTRQFLRGAERMSLRKIRIVDRDPQCRAATEFQPLKDDRIEFHFEDWKDFLFAYFAAALEKSRNGEEVSDHYVPPTFAPHILLEVFLELSRRASPSLVFKKIPADQEVGTPVDMALPAGTRALSFATWTCPASCIEPPTCPHTRGPKDWDMKDYLSRQHPGITILQCRHYAMGVGTIPVKAILKEYERFEETARSPGVHRMAVATVSSCHGLIGMVEAQNG